MSVYAALMRAAKKDLVHVFECIGRWHGSELCNINTGTITLRKIPMFGCSQNSDNNYTARNATNLIQVVDFRHQVASGLLASSSFTRPLAVIC